jgi:PAS domain S-box-containing protein/putative nucleotidyltransferase with HDIG domain
LRKSKIELSISRNEMDVTLKEKENWAFTVLRSISDGVITTDKNGSITFMNPVAEAQTGWMFTEVMGEALKNMISFKDEGDVLADDESPGIRRSGESVVMLSKKAMLVNKKAHEIPVYYGSSPVRNGKGDVIGDILVIRDIVEEMTAKDNIDKRMKELRKVIEGTIEAVSLVVETRDSYTAEHQKRVARLACSIGEEMGLSEAQKNSILVAGALHDIGKIYLPTEILNKPGQLSGSEYSSIMNHPQVGNDILKEIEFPWPVAQIVLQHHERMDGSGYPYGLEGDEILLEARILGVADVVEAMSDNRPHRQAPGIDKALAEISEENVLAFDEEVVAACLKLFKEKGFTFEMNGR